MADRRALSSDDIRFLQEFIHKTTRTFKHRSEYPDDRPDPSPEVLIVRTPEYGIAPLIDDLPSSSNCKIYKQSLENNELIETEFSQVVYNITTCHIPGSTYIGAKKDKYGTWFVSGTVDNCDLGTSTSTSTADTIETGTSTSPPVPPSPPGTSTSTSSDCDPITFSETDTRCEDDLLNVYTRTLTINLNTGGCLTKTTGDWHFSHAAGYCAPPEPSTIIINVTNITEITNVIENVLYFNTYNSTLNIYINGIWYIFCICDTTTGTGTGTSGEYWWCMSAPGTSTDTSFERITDCAACGEEGILDHLTFRIISGCAAATQTQPMVYSSVGPLGAGWYTPEEQIDDVFLGWFMSCNSALPGYVTILQTVNGTPDGDFNVEIPIACNPFDTGEFGITAVFPCDPTIPTIIRIFE